MLKKKLNTKRSSNRSKQSHPMTYLLNFLFFPPGNDSDSGVTNYIYAVVFTELIIIVEFETDKLKEKVNNFHE